MPLGCHPLHLFCPHHPLAQVLSILCHCRHQKGHSQGQMPQEMGAARVWHLEWDGGGPGGLVPCEQPPAGALQPTLLLN